MNIYLDLDGVLLIKETNSPANYVTEFLKYMLAHHDVYWLTSHVKGDTKHILEHIKDTFPPDACELAKQIKPTNWETHKSEGIDFSKDFRWFDDYITDSEKKALEEQGCLENFILLDLKKNPDALKAYVLDTGDNGDRNTDTQED